MANPVIPSLLTGLFGLGSNIATNIGAKRRERDARRFNERMERDRRAYDTKQWERQLAYNHPLQQMQRLSEAGLNPNLIYGSSPGSAVGNAAQSPTGKAVTGQAPSYRIDNPMVPFMNAKVQQAQANNLNTQAMKNIAGANLSNTQSKSITDKLASEVKILEHTATKTEQESFQASIKSKAMNNKETGLAVKYATEVKKLMAEQNILEAQTEVQKLNKLLAQNGIRPGDSLWYRFMAYGFNLVKDATEDVRKEYKEKVHIILEQLEKLNFDGLL